MAIQASPPEAAHYSGTGQTGNQKAIRGWRPGKNSRKLRRDSHVSCFSNDQKANERQKKSTTFHRTNWWIVSPSVQQNDTPRSHLNYRDRQIGMLTAWFVSVFFFFFFVGYGFSPLTGSLFRDSPRGRKWWGLGDLSNGHPYWQIIWELFEEGNFVWGIAGWFSVLEDTCLGTVLNWWTFTILLVSGGFKKIIN